jgi:outer membrane lipoprotein SlyB
MTMTSFKTLGAAAACLFLLGGCAYQYGPRTYGGYETQGEQAVRFGVVESIREVGIQAPETGVGTASGAMLGSIAGSYAGHSSAASFAGAIGGALLGGLLGQGIERSANQHPGIELVVLLDSGKYISVVQPAEDYAFRSGDRVRVLSGRGMTRVTP